MKRLAAAGTFALLAGGAALLLLASIFYSCRGGGQPHDMGTSAAESPPSHDSQSAPLQRVTDETFPTNVTDRVEPGPTSVRL